MNRYFLIGDYNQNKVTSVNSADRIIVTIPLKGDDGNLKYGIGNALKKLNEKDIYPTENGIDILILAGLVYLADTRISRSRNSEDSWTREISIEIPVYNLAKWAALSDLFIGMLDFLTGDKWSLSFVKRDDELSRKSERENSKPKFDAVTLFSGGMDSLIGTINHLENRGKIALISHAGDTYTKNVQRKLLSLLNEKYIGLNPQYLDLWMVFEKSLIPSAGSENTTRSRSFLFIAFGIFAISGMEDVSTLEVPENGLIALNVPLDELRIGSYSTRTTHPFYLKSWDKILKGLGFELTVQNPYWNKTKGEMSDQCLNKDFLLQVVQNSISCSSPHKARWSSATLQHCGYCIPCIIRRAAMNMAFGKGADNTPYTVSSISEIVDNHAKGIGEQLRSFQVAINRIKKRPQLTKILIHKSGPLSRDTNYLLALSDVYKRGLLEVDAFIEKETEVESDRDK